MKAICPFQSVRLYFLIQLRVIQKKNKFSSLLSFDLFPIFPFTIYYLHQHQCIFTLRFHSCSRSFLNNFHWIYTKHLSTSIKSDLFNTLWIVFFFISSAMYTKLNWSRCLTPNINANIWLKFDKSKVIWNVFFEYKWNGIFSYVSNISF